MAMSVVYATFGGQIVHENRGGVERRYLADPLGSTIALTDSGTAITDTWDYWPYGEVMSRTGTNPTPFTFVGTLGYFKDLLDKLFYVRARHYQPNNGRWLTVDPLWPLEAVYQYARSSPLVYVDSSGLQATYDDVFKKYIREWNDYLRRLFGEPCKEKSGVPAQGTQPCGPCPFSGSIGKLYIECNCVGWDIWVKDEFGPGWHRVNCGQWYRADGFLWDGDVYKIDGSTCVVLSCSDSTLTMDCCTSPLAILLGKRCPPYVVPPREFGTLPPSISPGNVLPNPFRKGPQL